MANMAAKIFAAALDEHDLRYSYVDDEERVINIGWKIDGGKLDLNFAFAEDNEDVQIFGFFLKVPEDKINVMYEACNQCNCDYRWAKFSVRKGQICVESDAVIQLDSCGEEVFGYMVRLTQIVEKAYPTLMKAMWR